MKKLILVRASREEDFLIKWRVTECCNYHCSYCIRNKFKQPSDNLKFDQELCVKTKDKILNLINKVNKTIKLELIGGEPTLIDLFPILSDLISNTNNYIKQILITTNFSRPINYFTDIINLCAKNNIQVNLVCSFHKEFIGLETFMNKIKLINSLNYSNLNLIVEMVQTGDLELENKFKNICEENNLIYHIDRDSRKGISINSESLSNNKKTELISLDEDNNLVEYSSFREFCNYKNFSPFGMLCTKDFDSFLIENGLHVGFDPENNQLGCRIKSDIDDFVPLTNLKVCLSKCNLCGNISVFDDFETFKKYYNKK